MGDGPCNIYTLHWMSLSPTGNKPDTLFLNPVTKKKNR